MKALSCAYVPPPSFPGALAFMANLQKYPPRGELLLYSDHPYEGTIRLLGSPDQFKNATFIEGKHAGTQNKFAVHNAVFLAGCAVARKHGADFMLYLESDCRVGRPGWDEIIFDEYFSLGRPTIVAGTCSAYNPSSFSGKAARRFAHEIGKPRKHGIPVGCYGWFGASVQGPSTWLPNGALAVYDMLWIERMFDLGDQGRLAAQNGPFDQAIAQRIWEMFGDEAFEVIGYLNTVYSGYSDILTSPEERRKLLTDGIVCGMHQEKTEWQP